MKRNTQLLNAGRWLQRNGDLEGAQRLFDQAAELDFPAYSSAPGEIVEVKTPALKAPAPMEPAVPEATTLTRLSWKGRELWLDSEGGPPVWVAIDDEVPLAPDAEFRVGSRRLRLRHLKAGQLYLEESTLDGQAVCAVLVHQAVITIGQGGCDLSYPRDSDLAPMHCELTPGPFGSFLRSLSPSALTFVRLPERGARVSPGTRVLIDQQLFQVGSHPLGLSLIT